MNPSNNRHYQRIAHFSYTSLSVSHCQIMDILAHYLLTLSKRQPGLTEPQYSETRVHVVEQVGHTPLSKATAENKQEREKYKEGCRLSRKALFRTRKFLSAGLPNL